MKRNSPQPYFGQGARIRALREAKGFTIDRLAEALGVTYQSAQQWELGQTSPRTSRLAKLAATLNTSVQFITTGKEGDLEESVISLERQLGAQILAADKEIQQAIQALILRYEADKKSGREIALAIKTLLQK